MTDPRSSNRGAGAVKGRGAIGNPDGRFERYRHEALDDGWPELAAADGPAQPRTELSAEATRTILATNESPDVPFDRSINPYKGCEHGCIYCFARPTHAYLGLSPGRDFETRLRYKPDAAEKLAALFAERSYRPRLIALGANTDPYQPAERQLGLTRAILEVCQRFRHPVSIVTKSALVLRDADILAEMAAENLAEVCISLTTLDNDLARRMEPRAAAPHRRLKTIGELSSLDLPITVLASPMIPAINDHELEAILEQAATAGARHASTLLIRLPREVRSLFEEWLYHHFPDRAGRVLSLIRQCHDGALYDARFGTRMRGQGAYADALFTRFHAACRRFGLDRKRRKLNTAAFRGEAENPQLALF